MALTIAGGALAEAALAQAEAQAKKTALELELAEVEAEAAEKTQALAKAAAEAIVLAKDAALELVLEKAQAQAQAEAVLAQAVEVLALAEEEYDDDGDDEALAALAKKLAEAGEYDDEYNKKCLTDKTNIGYYLLMTARIASLAGLALAAISELLVGLKIITFIGLPCSVSTSITCGLGLLAVCVPHVAAVLLAIACIAAICYLAYTVCSAKKTSYLIQGDVEIPTPGCSG